MTSEEASFEDLVLKIFFAFRNTLEEEIQAKRKLCEEIDAFFNEVGPVADSLGGGGGNADYSEELQDEVAETTPNDVHHGDYNKLFWEDLQSTKGPFQQTSKKATNNSDLFQELKAKLKKHKGFCIIGPFKYWFHYQDQDIIDRRKMKGRAAK